MPTYTFRGRDMTEAVEQVRVMLGSDAVIIDTLRGTDHIGRFVEITATGELKANQPDQHQEPPPRRGERMRDGRGDMGRRPGRASPPLPRGRGQMGQRAQRGGGIGAPSRRDFEGERNTPRGRRADARGAYPPSRKGSERRPAPRRSESQGMPSELALLQDPPARRSPVKGAERYTHPNSFTTEREPIIPQPIPAPGSQGRGVSPPDRRRSAYQEHGATAARSSVPQAPMGGRSASRQGVSHEGRASRDVPTSPRRRVVEGYDPRGVDPWGLEQEGDTPSQQTINGLGGSVAAVRDALAQGGHGEAVHFVTERLNEIVSYIQSSQTSGGVPAPVFEHLRQFQRQLQATGIETEYAEDLIEQTKARIRLNQLDKQVILAHLGQVLAQNLSCVNPLLPPPGVEKNVLAFIGPTGVGKTTTIAKIAAHAQLTHELPVTLISTDTFRMAAVEQLSRYASILDCPAQAAHSPEELWQLVDEAKTPLVLVDTTGRNPKTQGQLKGLFELFGEGWHGRTVLTLAANTREQDLKPIVEGFSPLKYNMVAVTKLDETYALGTVYNVSKLTQCPISWTTNGQRVPEDIELANSELLAVKIIMEAIAHKV